MAAIIARPPKVAPTPMPTRAPLDSLFELPEVVAEGWKLVLVADDGCELKLSEFITEGWDCVLDADDDREVEEGVLLVSMTWSLA